MAISKDEVAYTATLARLELSPEELERFGQDLARITAYVEQLNELQGKLTEAAPVLPLIKSAEALREDIPAPSLTVDQALSGAPDRQGEFFRVPKVIG